MCHIYVLKSRAYRKLYIGFTSKDVTERLKEHNAGGTKSTRDFRPWRIAYYEAYSSEKDARQRERMLKQYGSSWGHLKNRIKNSLTEK